MASVALLVFAVAADASAPSFEAASSIITRRCLTCHHRGEPRGGLEMTMRASLMEGGDSGAALVAGDPDASLLMSRLRSGEMPPPERGESRALPEEEIKAIERWIRDGAPWPDSVTLDVFSRTTEARAGRDWWALQPIRRPTPPTSSDGTPPTTRYERPASAIDQFVLARLEQHGLQAAPEADRETLIRRLYFDLVGFPPTREEIEAFQRDTAPDAYPQLVDRLLTSPQFGVRWARYWLDLVRYADTSGYERDQEKPFAWKYRDWVVDAINGDLPFDQFGRWQIAGDLVPARTERSVVGTGFLRLGTWNDEPNDPREYQYERLEDLVHATSSVFLGLTVKCARCHDHKFDPISQEDYYRFAAAYWTGPIAARDRELLGGPTSEELGVVNVLGWAETRPNVAPLKLLIKGDPARPSSEVTYDSLSTFDQLEWNRTDDGRRPSDRPARAILADWLFDARHPLTPRVIVNRLWQHHLGEGIVRTPNNFGFLGDAPTHPELLDWLADELVRNGWHLKHIHRLILLSRTYRQSSRHPAWKTHENVDADNRWLWRAHRRRLDADSLRDSILACTRGLDLRMSGPGFRPTLSPEALEGLSRKQDAWQASPLESQRRRSLYMILQRSLLTPMMMTFDAVDTSGPCGRRETTTVAPQALVLMNSPFIHTECNRLARHILMEAGSQRAEQIEIVWSRCLQRPPSPQEQVLATRYLEEQVQHFQRNSDRDAESHAIASLCQALFSSNEFLYRD